MTPPKDKKKEENGNLKKRIFWCFFFVILCWVGIWASLIFGNLISLKSGESITLTITRN